MLVHLRQDELESCLHPVEMEGQVAAGLVDPDAEVRWRPWTGESWSRVVLVEALKHAWEQPLARLQRPLRSRSLPIATLVVVVCLVLAALIQLVGPWAPEAGALGYAGLVLDGRWWTTWTGHLLHTRPVHFAGNLAIIAYSGFRTERALGAGGVGMVLGAAAALGGLAVVGLGDTPVVGASMLAYGLWGAQMAIGVRFGEAIPARLRRYYGAGSFLVFVPLFLLGIGSERASHLGHLGGLLGGGLAALWVPAETLASGGSARLRRWFNLGFGLMLSGLPALFAAGLGAAPSFAGWPWTRTAVPGSRGWEVPLPARFSLHPDRLGEMGSWHASAGETDSLFAGAFQLPEGQTLDEARLVADWQARLGRTVSAEPDAAEPGRSGPRALPPVEEEGWLAWRFSVAGSAQHAPARVEEWTRRVGPRLYRCGHLVAAHARPARVRLGRDFVARCRQATPGEP